MELDPDHVEALKLLRGIESRANEFMAAAVEMDLAGKWNVAAAKIALAIKTNPAVALFHNVKGALHRKKLEFNEVSWGGKGGERERETGGGERERD